MGGEDLDWARIFCLFFVRQCFFVMSLEVLFFIIWFARTRLNQLTTLDLTKYFAIFILRQLNIQNTLQHVPICINFLQQKGLPDLEINSEAGWGGGVILPLAPP